MILAKRLISIKSYKGLRRYQGLPVRAMELSEDDLDAIKHLQLLTLKPTLYIANVEEDATHP